MEHSTLPPLEIIGPDGDRIIVRALDRDDTVGDLARRLDTHSLRTTRQLDPDQRLADVLNWMLRTFSPNELEKTFEAYSAIEVNLLRKSPLTNVNELRRQLIEKIVENEHAN